MHKSLIITFSLLLVLSSCGTSKFRSNRKLTFQRVEKQKTENDAEIASRTFKTNQARVHNPSIKDDQVVVEATNENLNDVAELTTDNFQNFTPKTKHANTAFIYSSESDFTDNNNAANATRNVKKKQSLLPNRSKEPSEPRKMPVGKKILIIWLLLIGLFPLSVLLARGRGRKFRIVLILFIVGYGLALLLFVLGVGAIACVPLILAYLTGWVLAWIFCFR